MKRVGLLSIGKKGKKSIKETINSEVSGSKAVPSICKFHLQGRCQFGRVGGRCPDSHPGICKSFMLAVKLAVAWVLTVGVYTQNCANCL